MKCSKTSFLGILMMLSFINGISQQTPYWKMQQEGNDLKFKASGQSKVIFTEEGILDVTGLARTLNLQITNLEGPGMLIVDENGNVDMSPIGINEDTVVIENLKTGYFHVEDMLKIGHTIYGEVSDDPSTGEEGNHIYTDDGDLFIQIPPDDPNCTATPENLFLGGEEIKLESGSYYDGPDYDASGSIIKLEPAKPGIGGNLLLVHGVGQQKDGAIFIGDVLSTDHLDINPKTVNVTIPFNIWKETYFMENVGIGTNNPQTMLHVQGTHGTARIGEKESYIELGFNKKNAILDNHGSGILLINYYTGKDVHIGTGEETKSNVEIGGNLTARKKLFVMQGVGIGTDDPGNYQLAVNGTINAKRVDISENVPKSDFVFNEDYTLRSLKDVEHYINTHKHLPDIPSAREFEENGYSIGDMDNMLLQKVEELTLYTIAQQKELEKLKEENTRLKNQADEIDKLREEIEQLKNLMNTSGE